MIFPALVAEIRQLLAEVKAERRALFRIAMKSRQVITALQQ
jgi:hypothetical protein